MKKLLALCLTALMLACTACSATPNLGVDGSDLAPFIIGGIGPLSEDRARYGTSVMQGAQIAVNEINASGGVPWSMSSWTASQPCCGFHER